MDIFDDFTLYSYAHFENAVNIGWNPDETGRARTAGGDFKEALVRYLDHRVNMTRGGGVLKRFSYGEKTVTLGSAEIRVIAGDGTVYAVPDMVVDRVVNDSYCPPEELIDAVLNGVYPDDGRYRTYISKYDAEHFWGAPVQYAEKGKKALNVLVSGDVAGLSRFLEDDPGALTIVTAEGSLLNAAIRHGSEEKAILLLDLHIPIDRYNGGELFSAIDCDMAAVAERLINEGIPLHNYSPQTNPLFYAVYKCSNTIAKKLAEKKHLYRIYNTPYVQNCNLLQWCVRCRNREMMEFITEANMY